MRTILVIFALWVLVVEPTFRAFEQMEQHSSECSSGEAFGDADQLIPPGQVVAPCWVNEHRPVTLALPLPDLAGLAWLLQATAPANAPTPLPAELCMPFPPPALPLRL